MYISKRNLWFAMIFPANVCLEEGVSRVREHSHHTETPPRDGARNSTQVNALTTLMIDDAL